MRRVKVHLVVLAAILVLAVVAEVAAVDDNEYHGLLDDINEDDRRREEYTKKGWQLTGYDGGEDDEPQYISAEYIARRKEDGRLIKVLNRLTDAERIRETRSAPLVEAWDSESAQVLSDSFSSPVHDEEPCAITYRLLRWLKTVQRTYRRMANSLHEAPKTGEWDLGKFSDGDMAYGDTMMDLWDEHVAEVARVRGDFEVNSKVDSLFPISVSQDVGQMFAKKYLRSLSSEAMMHYEPNTVERDVGHWRVDDLRKDDREWSPSQCFDTCEYMRLQPATEGAGTSELPLELMIMSGYRDWSQNSDNPLLGSRFNPVAPPSSPVSGLLPRRKVGEFDQELADTLKEHPNKKSVNGDFSAELADKLEALRLDPSKVTFGTVTPARGEELFSPMLADVLPHGPRKWIPSP